MKASLIITILSFGFQFQLQAQSLMDLHNKLAEHSIGKLNDYIIEADSNNLDIARWGFLRELAPGYYEGIAHFNFYVAPGYRDSVGNNYKLYRLKVLSQADSIFYYQLEERKRMIGANGPQICYLPVATFENERTFCDLNLSFYKTYHASIDKSQLFIDSIVFGNYCGFVASSTPERKKINSWVKQKDTSSLLKWLSSPNSEKQVYAVDGFLQLRKNGYKLDKRTLEVIKYILRKSGTIRTCNGCIESAHEIKDMFKL